MQPRMIALFGALAFVVSIGGAFGQNGAEWIALRDNLKAKIYDSGVVGTGASREAVARFELSDPSVVANRAKAIDIADQLFGRVVMAPSDEQGFTRAAVHLLASGAGAALRFEGFHYVRGSNSVWLRQAGPEGWKTAQDPADWTPPKSRAFTLPAGAVYVDFTGEIFTAAGSTKSFGIEMRSSVPVSNAPAKYIEMKQLWEQAIARDKLKAAGFDHVRIENYSEPMRGKFQVRKMVFLNVKRKAEEDWPALPNDWPAPSVSTLPGGPILGFGGAAPASPGVDASQEPVTNGFGIAAGAASEPPMFEDFLAAP